MIETSALPPGPYEPMVTARPGEHIGSGHVYLVDSNDRKIASLWGTPDEKIALANLIICAHEQETIQVTAKAAEALIEMLRCADRADSAFDARDRRVVADILEALLNNVRGRK